MKSNQRLSSCLKTQLQKLNSSLATHLSHQQNPLRLSGNLRTRSLLLHSSQFYYHHRQRKRHPYVHCRRSGFEDERLVQGKEVLSVADQVEQCWCRCKEQGDEVEEAVVRWETAGKKPEGNQEHEKVTGLPQQLQKPHSQQARTRGNENPSLQQVTVQTDITHTFLHSPRIRPTVG